MIFISRLDDCNDIIITNEVLKQIYFKYSLSHNQKYEVNVKEKTSILLLNTIAMMTSIRFTLEHTIVSKMWFIVAFSVRAWATSADTFPLSFRKKLSFKINLKNVNSRFWVKTEGSEGCSKIIDENRNTAESLLNSISKVKEKKHFSINEKITGLYRNMWITLVLQKRWKVILLNITHKSASSNA